MLHKLSIGQLGKTVGLSSKTIRYYEEIHKEGKYCCNILHQLIELKKGGNAYAE